ncbi:MAG TPA: hypothetical protein VFE33_19930 [Thermoanaerobaculia bacterium]|nr:hypothetical protein [Thermoanaerobaculia bacterium]
MKTFDPEETLAGAAGLDESLRHALDLPPETAARVIRGALGAAPQPARPPARRGLPRWLPVAAALVLSLVLVLFLAREPAPPAPRRASITNVGDIVIATTPEGEGRLLRSAGSEPTPSGSTLIIRRGGTP